MGRLHKNIQLQLYTVIVIKYLICGNNWSWLLNLNLIYKTLLTGAGSDFSAGKTWLVFSFDQSNNTGTIDLKMDSSVLEEKSFTMQALAFSSKLTLTLSLLLKLPPRKLDPLFILWDFLLPRLLFISVNLPCGHVWITVVMSGLVLLAATWNC